MAVRQSLSKNNFWGLVQQDGPWKETRSDIERSRTGGIVHPGHGDWKIMVNPYQQNGRLPKQPLSRILQRKVNTSPLKFSLGPTPGRGMTKRLSRPGGLKPTDIEVGGNPGPPTLGGNGGHPGPPTLGGNGDGAIPTSVTDEIKLVEGEDGAGLADNSEDVYEDYANWLFQNSTAGVNLPGLGYGGDINLAESPTDYYSARSQESASTIYHSAVEPDLLQKLDTLTKYDVPQEFNLTSSDLEKLFELTPVEERKPLMIQIENGVAEGIRQRAIEYQKSKDLNLPTQYQLSEFNQKMEQLSKIKVPSHKPIDWPEIPNHMDIEYPSPGTASSKYMDIEYPSTGRASSKYMDVDVWSSPRVSHTGLTADLEKATIAPVSGASFKPPGNGTLQISPRLKEAQDTSFYDQFIPKITSPRPGVWTPPPAKSRPIPLPIVTKKKTPKSSESYVPSASTGETSGSGNAPPPPAKSRRIPLAIVTKKKAPKSSESYVPSASTGETSGSGNAPRIRPVNSANPTKRRKSPKSKK